MTPEACTQGHRSTLILPTAEGGSICLLCLSNLLSNPKSPTVHVSYALSQLSQALSQPQFLHSLLTFHSHFLISPLVSVLSNFDDEPIAKQTIDLILTLCDGSNSNSNGNQDVHKEFVARVSDWLSRDSLAWSRRQLYMLHCFGVLLDNQDCNLNSCIKSKDALIFKLVTGLQLSKSSLLHYTYTDDSGTDVWLKYCPKLLYISLDILMKSQSDDVRLNCVAFLTVLAQRGFFQSACSNYVGNTDSFEADNFMHVTEHVIDGPPLEVLFAEAVKGPLLSSDSQVQIATLDLVSSKDPIVNSSIRVLDLLSNVEQAFRQRLAIGFSTLVPILRYVAEIPFQPVQCQLLKLILDCVLNTPGIVSTCSGEEISSILAGMFKKHIDGEIGMLPETFTLSCSILVAIMQCSSSRGNSSLAASVKDAVKSAVSTCINNSHINTDQILHCLYLLKEAYAYGQEDNFPASSKVGLEFLIIDILKSQILPWFMTVINEMEEEVIALGVIETFHPILHDSNDDAKDFAEILVSSSWFGVLFGCLGLFPTEKMKWRVYLIFSSIVDVLLGSDSGQPIRDAALDLPSDPTDLLFLLGQKSYHNPELFCCQCAVLLVLYVSSLYNDRIADEKLVLSSLEQFILLNSSDFLCGASASVTIEILLLAEKDWDILSTKIHLTSLRWLFQQEKLCKSLSAQILKFCRCNSSIGNNVVIDHETSQKVDLHLFAELITSGDNFGAMIFICLLGDLVENGCEDYDIISVLKAFDGLPEPAVASDGWTDEVLIILGILSLILHHSTKEALTEASKIIILNVPLVSTINTAISEACSKGHALFDHDEGTKTGEILIFVLSLLFFALRSVRAVLPGIITDFQFWFDEGRDIQQPLSYLSIRCHDLCKLMHFGSAPVKLVALLKLSKVPSWMTKVFDESSIGSIIQNISASSINTELVVLFRELLDSGHLNSAHVADLNRIFQASRRNVYADDIQDSCIQDRTENVAVNVDDHVGKARAFLVSLVSSQSHPECHLWSSQSSYLSAESANRMQFGNSSFHSQGVTAKTFKDESMEVFPSVPSGDHSAAESIAEKTLDHEGSSMVSNANTAPSAGLLFKDQQLKQLRAQCIVFLAFKNDGTRGDITDRKGKEQLVNDPSSKSCSSILDSDSSKEVDFAKLSEKRSSRPVIPAENEQDRKCSVARGKTNVEVLTHEATELHASAKREPHDASTGKYLTVIPICCKSKVLKSVADTDKVIATADDYGHMEVISVMNSALSPGRASLTVAGVTSNNSIVFGSDLGGLRWWKEDKKPPEWPIVGGGHHNLLVKVEGNESRVMLSMAGRRLETIN
ncbi:hypothetical protein DH2020_005004 [Rehmannia glutinosa]|uniref:Uncharacterized protein n=1 Tax=Rehmannia glutinosa TaxID=99300 RepID=A0ABR0XRC1_REHGL